MNKIPIEIIDDIGQELRDRLCNYKDFGKRDNFEGTCVHVIIEHLREYIKGKY